MSGKKGKLPHVVNEIGLLNEQLLSSVQACSLRQAPSTNVRNAGRQSAGMHFTHI